MMAGMQKTLIAVAAVVMFLVGYPVYLYVDASVTGGKKNVGDAWAVLFGGARRPAA